MTDIPEERTALVTGACGGMGRDIARQLHASRPPGRACRPQSRGPRRDCTGGRPARAPHRLRPHHGAPEAAVSAVLGRSGRHRRARQQRRLWRIEAFLDMTGAWERTLRHQRHGARHADHGGGPRDGDAAVRTDRQRHLARLPHGAPELHRLCREQGRRRRDHAGRRGGARAVRRARQQRWRRG